MNLSVLDYLTILYTRETCERIRLRREELKLTQAHVAGILKMSQGAYSKLELYKSKKMKWGSFPVSKLIQTLNMGIEELVLPRNGSKNGNGRKNGKAL